MGDGVASSTTQTGAMTDVRGGQVHLLRGGDGPPLLFLHAAGGAGAWHPFLDRLAERFEVFAPDHPGFGLSDTIDEVEGVDDLVYHYLELMDRLGLERPAVVGASFGGWVAAELAVHSPHRVGALALLSPVGVRIPGSLPADLFLMTPAELGDALFHDPAAGAAFVPADPTVDDILQAYKDMSGLARYGWSPFLNDPKLERRLHRVDSPTLVLWPGDDRIVPRPVAEAFAAGIPGARLDVIADCGHAMYFEQPDAFADAVLRHLAG
jgi:pimeloyl-ACP methyl ester carboxylesterase